MRQPKPWIAVVLSVISPGLGHLYCGHILAAVMVVAVLDTIIVPAILAIQFAPVATLVGIVLFMPTFYVAVALHAARTAKTPTDRFVTKLRLVGAVLFFYLLTVGAGEGLRSFRNQFLGQPFRISSAAMLPTLIVGDHFYADARAYNRAEPQRGDIIVFTVARDGSTVYPADSRPDLSTETFVKRIVGLPGDTIVLEGATLTVNGSVATQSPMEDTYEGPDGGVFLIRGELLGTHEYQVLDDPEQQPSTGEFIVEPNRYFVSGDNRLRSNDSRYWGTIRRDAIIGKVTKIYWSWSFNGSSAKLFSPVEWFRLLRTETRWERIGRQPG